MVRTEDETQGLDAESRVHWLMAFQETEPCCILHALSASPGSIICIKHTMGGSVVKPQLAMLIKFPEIIVSTGGIEFGCPT